MSALHGGQALRLLLLGAASTGTGHWEVKLVLRARCDAYWYLLCSACGP